MIVRSQDDIHQEILERVAAGKRMSREEALSLFSCDLLLLAKGADEVRKRLHPENIVTFVIDRNVSYTNICHVDCGFCAFHEPVGSPKGYLLSEEEVLSKVGELVEAGGTQVLMQGGIHPDVTLSYCLRLVQSVRRYFPMVHIHSFSCVEIDHLAKKENISAREVLVALKEAGLNSLPGAGAEVLAERVRKIISPKKLSVGRWLDMMKTAHEIGLRTTATMVIGHVETPAERIEHLDLLRNLQDETGGFRAFIPWTFVPQGTPGMSHLERTDSEDYLRTIAIARLFLDNVENIQSGWLTEGLRIGQIALGFGANDMGGTLIEDKVLEPTGIKIKTRKEDLIRVIKRAGFVAAQRDTNYKILKVFDQTS